MRCGCTLFAENAVFAQNKPRFCRFFVIVKKIHHFNKKYKIKAIERAGHFFAFSSVLLQFITCSPPVCSLLFFKDSEMSGYLFFIRADKTLSLFFFRTAKSSDIVIFFKDSKISIFSAFFRRSPLGLGHNKDILRTY